MKTDNYFVPVRDMEKARRFYGDVLKLEMKFDFSQMGMIAYRVGDDEPAIILKDLKKFPDAKPAVWLEVEDVREIYLKLKDCGVKFLSEPFRIKTGWAAEFDDPSGNRLGITDYKAE